MAQTEPIAIVGMGAHLPGAPDVETYWRNIRDGVDATSEVPADRWDALFYDPESNRPDRFYCRRGGFISDPTFDAVGFGVMPVAVDDAEPDQLMALQVAQTAVDDAAGAIDAIDPERIGVILGRGGYLTAGMARLDQRVRVANQVESVLRSVLPDLAEDEVAAVGEAFRRRIGEDRPEAAIGLVPNLVASRIANRLDLRGPAFTIDAACASSLLAVEQSVDALRSGRCDVMVAGGVHHCHDVTFWSVFNQLGALSRSERIRPFDRSADGLLIGEGTGIVVLKRLRDAERDDDRIYALIRGVGSSSDGRASSLMKPRVSGQVLALTRAWTDAGTNPDHVGLIEAHGTATPAGDEAELATLGQFFGPTDGRRAGLGSVKSMIGHTMPTAGIAGLIKTTLALHHETLPPTLHCDDPHAGLAATRFRIVSEAEPWTANGSPRTAGVNAFGFGGVNGHVVLEEVHRSGRRGGSSTHRPGLAVSVTSPRSGSSPGSAGSPIPPTLLLAADDLGAMARLLDQDDRALIDSARATPPMHSGGVRLALVDPSPKRLALARTVVGRGRPWRGRSDLWFTADPLLGPDGGGIAFCHPGVEPTFEPHTDDLTDHLGLAPSGRGDGSWAERVREIVALGRTLDEALRRLGVAPDLIFGHSVGEWAAMNTSGLIPLSQADAFAATLDARAFTVPDAWYVALGCSADVARGLVEGLAATALSHDNCPHQSMVCGPDAEVDVVVARAKEHRVMAQKLPFRSGFHSPLLAGHLAPFSAGLDRLPLEEPHTPLWSATTVAPYPHDSDQVRELALRHLVEPVSFGPLVQRLYHKVGIRAFVQVGTGSTTGFVDDALRGLDVLVVGANDPKRSGVAQITRVLAALWAEGHEPDWSTLRSPEGPPAPTKATALIPLRLGSPLIHLAEAAPLLSQRTSQAPTSPGGGTARRAVANSGPLGATLEDLFDAMDRSSADVLGALSQSHAARPNGGARPKGPVHVDPTDAGDGADSPVGATTSSTGTTRRVTFSTDEMPWLLDHCFYRQPEGWTELRDRFPVAPMTAMVELMRDEVARVTGRTVVAMRSVRALRWLAAAPAATVTVKTGPEVEGTVKVSVDGHARAVAVLGDGWPAPPTDTILAPLTEALPSERTAAAMYRERMMFHGPAYQGVTALGPVGANGLDAELESLAAPGGLLDSTGQAMGYWMMISTQQDRLALPVSIDELAFYGPQPPHGDGVDAQVRITDLDPGRVRADHELRHDGRLWCRITGWEDRRFQSDDLLWPMFVHPEHNLLTEPQRGGWELVRERWPDTPSRELVLRRYTTHEERTHHDALNPRAQRSWLLGRIAAKDAVRRLLWADHPGPLFPGEVQLTNDDEGRPIAHLRTGAAPHISLAHLFGVAVAICSPDHPVGIDICAVDDASEHVDALALTPEESSRLAPGGPERSEGIARAWAVKEAAGKASGTGLAGRPRQLEIDHVEGSRHRVGRWLVDTETIEVDGSTYVVAWTTGGEQ